MDYYINNVDYLQLRLCCPHDISKLKEFLNCGEHGCNWVAWVLNRLLGNVLRFQELVRHQLTVVVL